MGTCIGKIWNVITVDVRNCKKSQQFFFNIKTKDNCFLDCTNPR